MSNLSTHIRKEKPRLMNKEDKEYWRKKVADKLSSKRSDLNSVFESDIQKMKDKKWKSFLKSLNLETKLSTYAFYMKDYWKFKDEKDKIERLQAYSLDFTLDSGSGNYIMEETVYQGDSLSEATVTGEVASWSSTTKILNLINMTGNFSGTKNIIGDTSGASYTITAFNPQDYSSSAAGDNLAIEQEADSIIDFTEGNPFGSL